MAARVAAKRVVTLGSGALDVSTLRLLSMGTAKIEVADAAWARVVRILSKLKQVSMKV